MYEDRECSDQSKSVCLIPFIAFLQSDHCANTAVVNTSQQFTFLVGSSGLAYVEMVIVGDVLGELLVLLWHFIPLCAMAFVTFLFQPSFPPSLIFQFISENL